MSEEIGVETDNLTFNVDDFDNLQTALMKEQTVESQENSDSEDDGLLKVLSFDSEVNISSPSANQNVNSSSQSCKNLNIKRTALKTYKRKQNPKIGVAVPKFKKNEQGKNVVDDNTSKAVKNSTFPQTENQNIDQKSEIQDSLSHFDEEDECSLIKIKENMYNYSGITVEKEKSSSSDNVPTKTIIRKRGRPKKNITKTKKRDNKCKSNKSIIAKCEETQHIITKSTHLVGRPSKKKNVQVGVQNTRSTSESVIKNSSLQPSNANCTVNSVGLGDILESVVEDLSKTLHPLENDTTDNIYSDNTMNLSYNNKLNQDPTEVEEKPTNKTQLDLSNNDSHHSNYIKMPMLDVAVMPNFEYNIDDDSIAKESNNKVLDNRSSDTENQKQNTCSTLESSCGRPQRRKFKLNLCYDEYSDEDPFANVELSDDGEPIGFKKSNRYNSDDEYVPVKKLKKVKKFSESYTSDSDVDKNVDELKKPRKRQKTTKIKKNEKKLNMDVSQKDTNQTEDDFFKDADNSQTNENNELCSDNQYEARKVDDEQTPIVVGEPEEIENYLAKKIQGTNLQIKRVSSIETTSITPIDIPVIDSYMAKKSVDASSQTNILKTTSTSVQTTTADDLGMKINVPLTVTQREKACEFLKDTVKMTSELGELMTQKSEDFIQKKINTGNIIDTFKMDYCVKKTFLLFKLAKHNLKEMEENLTKQYEDFLIENKLIQYREVPKSIIPTLILSENDSDCEIIEESSEINSKQCKEKPQPKLNLKTVFLNKELSIKIAKKPSEEQKSKEKINIKGKNTVWINDSVLLKKVNSKQSFLAQDSRNKKPPDKYITNKMVSDFFKNYYHQKVLSICAPLISSEWSDFKKTKIWCYHFCVEPLKLNSSLKNIHSSESINDIDTSFGHNANDNTNILNSKLINTKTLFSICIEVLQKNMFCLMKNPLNIEEMKPKKCDITDLIQEHKPLKLSQLCLHTIRNIFDKKGIKPNSTLKSITSLSPPIKTLKKLSYNKIIHSFYKSVQNEIKKMQSNESIVKYQKCRPVISLESNSVEHQDINKLVESHVCYKEILESKHRGKNNNQLQNLSPNSLKQITFSFIVDLMIKHVQQNAVHLNVDNNNKHALLKTNIQFRKSNDLLKASSPKSLKHITYTFYIHHTMLRNKIVNRINEPYEIHMDLHTNNEQFIKRNDQLERYTIKSLKHIVFTSIMHIMTKNKSINTLIKKCSPYCSKRETLRNKPFKDTILENHFYCLPKSLKHITYLFIKNFMICNNKNILVSNNYKIINSDNIINKNSMEKVEYVKETYKRSKKILDSDLCNIELKHVKSLLKICSEKITLIFCENNNVKQSIFDDIQINCVNKVPEEIFLNLKNPSLKSKEVIIDTGESNNDGDDYWNDNDCNETLSQVHSSEYKQELTEVPHCFSQIVNDGDSEQRENCNGDYENTFFFSQIKTESIENSNLKNPEPFIKTELDESFEETDIVPQIENTPLKHEYNFHSDAIITENPINFCSEHNILKVDKIEYENQTVCDNDNTEQVVFSQSFLRVHKQFEPDFDNENDNTMSLLIPQTYKSLPTKTIQSCSDLTSNRKNMPNKKKCYKRKRKQILLTTKKKSALEQEPTSFEEINELADNKTSNEEGNVDNSDSDSIINMPLWKRLRKTRKCKKDSKKQRLIAQNDEIQCNNVDSTQNVSEDKDSICYDDKTERDCSNVNSTGLVEHNAFVDDANSKIRNSINSSNLRIESSSVADKQQFYEEDYSDQSFSPEIHSDEKIELLQCEPDVPPVFAYDSKDGKDIATYECKSNESDPGNNENKSDDFRTIPNNTKWQYNSIKCNDTKLYQEAIVVLEKLPEPFVNTYLQFQDSAEKSKDIIEIERFREFKTLLHETIKDTFETIRECTSSSVHLQIDSKTNLFDSHDVNNVIKNEGNLDNSYNTFKISENCAITNENFKDHSNDKKLFVKEETGTDNIEILNQNTQLMCTTHLNTEDISTGVSTMAQDVQATKESDDDNLLMMTAEKVMNEDLKLLNEPVLVHLDYNGSTPCEIVNKNQPTNVSRCTTKTAGTSLEDRSSSEEEKEWVNTKEKLLKKLVKKQEESRLDDAKEAKIVNDFLEKCEASEPRKRYRRCSSIQAQKKITKTQNQLSLSMELTGESSEESYSLGRRSCQSFSKGRRNIRKVIDKKSLARSTLIANIEENERKQRLHQRQKALRERLGCEDDVNVVVINDELCLEYDLEENTPIVSIHNFYTSVMKVHQYEGVKFMWESCFESLAKIEAGHAGGGCILAHCMGLGKTLQVLALLHTVLTHPRINMQRVLVCCPVSTVLNWVDEINKWMRPVTNQIKVFELSRLKKIHERAYQLDDWYKCGGIFIIGYESFRNLTMLDPFIDKIRPSIINKIKTSLLNPGPGLIICDEGHLLKNDSSILAVAMSRIATKRRIVLTGTPIQNNLREYYCMVNFVKPNLLGHYSEYSNRFENPIMNGQHRDSREEDIKLMKARTHILHKVLEGVLQRQEASVLYPYLPKKHEYTVFIPLSKCQYDLYKHYLTYYTQDNHNVLKDFHILQKIWTHPQVLHNFYLKTRDENNRTVKAEKLEDDLTSEDLLRSEDTKTSQTEEMWWLQYLNEGDLLNTLESSNKFLVVFRILEECIAFGDKVLIFSTSLFTMDTLEYFLKKINNWSLGREYYRLDGSVPAEVRQKWCREFNAEINTTTKLFLVSTRTGSLGLNMTAANRVIIFDTSWNPAHDIQSIFRVYRFGQKKDCYVYRLVAMGTMEQKIYERSVTKQAISCRVVDEQQIDRHYSMDELSELYKLDEAGAGVECGVSEGVTDVALLRVARDAPLHAVHEHDSLLRGSVEQQLPEDERAAAWRQFEQEQENNKLVNLGESPQITPIECGHDNIKLLSLPVDTINEEKEYISEAQFDIKQINEQKDSTKVEQETIQNDVHSNGDTDEEKVELIQDNSEHEDIPNYYGKVNVENMINRMKNIIKVRLQDFPFSDNDTLRNNIGNLLLQSTSKNIASSNEQITEKDHETLDTCSETEIKNDINENYSDLNNGHETCYDNQTRCYDNIEKLADGQTDESTITVAKEKHTSVHILDEEKEDVDEKNVHYVDDDISISALELNTPEENDKQATFDDNKVILLSDAETITDNEEPNQDITPTPDKVHLEVRNKDIPEVANEINSILLSDDEEDDIIINTNQSEVKAVNITECTDEKTNDDDNEELYVPGFVLTSEYFIKVVAQSYVTQIPNLNEESALLTARHNIQKAFEETTKTKENLYSGHIYDIAVKAFGKDILKKIQKVNNFTAEITKSTTETLKCDNSEVAPFKKHSNINQINIDLTSDDESLTKANSSRNIITEGALKKRIRERLGSSSSDDLIILSDEPINRERYKIKTQDEIVNKPLPINTSKTKKTIFAPTASGVKVQTESPSTSGNETITKWCTLKSAKNSLIPATKRANDNNKRSSSCEIMNKAKKRKSSDHTELSLENFNIDDIGDIIELE